MNDRHKALLTNINIEIPGVKTIKKSDSFLFGKLFKFNNNFTATIGKTIYVPDLWDITDDFEKYETIRHEIVHVRQFYSWPFKFLAKPYLWLINAFIFGFCYLFCLPMFWTFRAKAEKEAYLQTLLVYQENGYFKDLTYLNHMREFLTETFTGSGYFYMSTESQVNKWLDKVTHDVLSGKIKNDKDRLYY